jgi:hypothetical protein
MEGPVKTHSAHSAELESKKLSNRGRNLFLDFSLNRIGQREWSGQDCFTPPNSFGGKFVFVRQLRGPHLSTCRHSSEGG